MKKRRWLLLGAAILAAGIVSSSVYADGYKSELTNLEIDASLRDQRPIAVMVDNESIALPHFGLAEGDVVYELMNSTANNRISRLMVILKDWGAINQMGCIRSVRTSNIPLAAEWNAILCHDGGPFYVDAYFAQPYAAQHFSGGFSRVNNGKAVEFTEFILRGDLDAKFNQTGFTRNYNDFAPSDPTHFEFSDEEIDLSARFGATAIPANEIALPFWHNSSMLRYDAASGTYDYYDYGSLHTDAEDGEVLSFKNVLLQDCVFEELDQNGYMNYQVVDSGRSGYYITNGKAIPVTWTKSSETDITRFYDLMGNEISINTGKTYIGLIPYDTWGNVTIQ